MRSLFFVLNALMLALAMECDPTHAAESKRPPNFVVILMDDMGWRDVGFMGNSFVETPNIDRLAKEGLRAAGAADRRTWIRRVSFDVTGLPPTTSGALRPEIEMTGAGLNATDPLTLVPFNDAVTGTVVATVTGAVFTLKLQEV